MKKLLISIGILCAVCLGGFGMQSLKANADVAITEMEETVEEVVEETVVEEVIEETTEEINPTAVVPPGTTYIIQGTLYWQDDNGSVCRSVRGKRQGLVFDRPSLHRAFL